MILLTNMCQVSVDNYLDNAYNEDSKYMRGMRNLDNSINKNQ